jgi:hypothetical protein
MRSTTWNGLSPRGRSLERRFSEKRSFLKCNQTQSPSSNTALLRPLLAWWTYYLVLLSMFSRAFSWIIFTNSTFFLPFKFTRSLKGERNNFKWWKLRCRMYTSIESKFNMWKTIFPCFQVLFNDSTQQRRQSSVSLLVRLSSSYVIID